MKRSQVPGTQQRIEEEVNMQEIVENLRTEAVLAGRVYDMGIINLPGMWTLSMTWWKFNHGCIYSTRNLISFTKKKLVNSITTFNLKKMGVSSQD